MPTKQGVRVCQPVPTIEVYADASGGFRWRLIDPDGGYRCASERYVNRDAARRAAEAVRLLSHKAEVTDA